MSTPVLKYIELHSVTSDLEGNVDNIIKYLENLKARNPGYDSLWISIERDYDDERDLMLYGVRPETDEEKKLREDLEDRHKKTVEERERAALQSLLTKYGAPSS